MKKKRALISGISGQDGAYLASLLLNKGYTVYGGERQNASGSLWRLKELGIEKKVKILPFELLEENNINDVIRNGKFDEIYNLAAQSFVGNSYGSPVFTSNVNALGVTRILEAIRHFSKYSKFYQASTSEMYGNSTAKTQNEKTEFKPVSPYAISKLYAHWLVNMYRDAYGLFCCSGILFNHESPLRGDEFVTKKIISNLAMIKYGLSSKMSLGNIYSKRDWGFSKDYVEAMWKMLQQKKPDDFVIATGKQYSVKDFVNTAAKELDIKIKWTGKGSNEKGIDCKTNKVIIEIDKKYFRPTEVDSLKGNYNKAKKILKWSPKINFKKLVKEMVESDLKEQKK
mgnify:CR=1 FL=1